MGVNPTMVDEGQVGFGPDNTPQPRVNPTMVDEGLDLTRFIDLWKECVNPTMVDEGPTSTKPRFRVMRRVNPTMVDEGRNNNHFVLNVVFQSHHGRRRTHASIPPLSTRDTRD